MDKKRCSRCEVEMDLALFYTNKNRKDGVSVYCKSCSKEYGGQQYRKNTRDKECKYCHIVFATTKNKQYCSRKCVNTTKQKEISGYKACLFCGKQFPYMESLIVRGMRRSDGTIIAGRKQRFCSKKCALVCRNTSEATREKLRSYSGEKSKLWMGDSAGYSAKHIWMRKTYGRASICEDCGTKDSKKYEWANISKKYMRERSDWKQLCASCHDKYDRVQEKLWATRRSKNTPPSCHRSDIRAK